MNKFSELDATILPSIYSGMLPLTGIMPRSNNGILPLRDAFPCSYSGIIPCEEDELMNNGIWPDTGTVPWINRGIPELSDPTIVIGTVPPILNTAYHVSHFCIRRVVCGVYPG